MSDYKILMNYKQKRGLTSNTALANDLGFKSRQTIFEVKKGKPLSKTAKLLILERVKND